jgi:hypothetical protein
MKDKAEYLHAKRLEDLCRPENLREIGEIPEEIRIIIKEPIYKNRKWSQDLSCPDLFINYYNSQWTIAELKHSFSKEEKAYEQIESGAKLLVDAFGVPLRNITGKIVVYSEYDFEYEIMRLKL